MCFVFSLLLIINGAFTLKLDNENKIINRTNILTSEKSYEDYQVLKGKFNIFFFFQFFCCVVFSSFFCLDTGVSEFIILILLPVGIILSINNLCVYKFSLLFISVCILCFIIVFYPQYRREWCRRFS